MNKCLIFFTFAVACAMGAPASPAQEAIRKLPALDHEEVHDEQGQYSLRYVTAEGTIVVEKGTLIPNPDGEGKVMVVEGQVTYVGDDGQVYTSKYSAGVDGVKVESSHTPAVLPLSVAGTVEIAAVPAAPVVEVSAVPVASAVEVPAVRLEPAIEVSAVPSVEVAAVPAFQITAIPAAPLLPALSVLSVPEAPIKSDVSVTVS